ncbi:MAG TPA: hypothetical protein VFE65_15855 [Pseudonocardia sp.]|nr:hypothetical protein [Pseudonocardia sp.]
MLADDSSNDLAVPSDVLRLSGVLADMRFPAMTWQLIAHAEYRGADWRSRAELRSLPAGAYRTLAAVLDAVASARGADPARSDEWSARRTASADGS